MGRKLTGRLVGKITRSSEPINFDEEEVHRILLAYELLIIGIQTPEPKPHKDNKLVKFACATLYHLMVCCNSIWSFGKPFPSVLSLVDALAKCLLPPILWWILYSKTHALRDVKNILSHHIEYRKIGIKPLTYSIPFCVFIPLVVFGDSTIASRSKNLSISENLVPDVLVSVWMYFNGWTTYVLFQGIYTITGLFYIVQCRRRSYCVSRLNNLWHLLEDPHPHKYFDVCKNLLKNLEYHMSGEITIVLVHCWIEFMTTVKLTIDILAGRAAEISVVTCIQVIVLYCCIVLSANHLKQTLTEFRKDLDAFLPKSESKEMAPERESARSSPVLTASGLVLNVRLLKITLFLAVCYGVMLYNKKYLNNILMNIF